MDSRKKPVNVKKRYLYAATLSIFVFAAGFIVVKYQKTQKNNAARFYPLLDRKNISGQEEEWKVVRKKFDDATKVAATNPADLKSRIELASLYIREARVTGNYMYY